MTGGKDYCRKKGDWRPNLETWLQLGGWGGGDYYYFFFPKESKRWDEMCLRWNVFSFSNSTPALTKQGQWQTNHIKRTPPPPSAPHSLPTHPPSPPTPISHFLWVRHLHAGKHLGTNCKPALSERGTSALKRSHMSPSPAESERDTLLFKH